MPACIPHVCWKYPNRSFYAQCLLCYTLKIFTLKKYFPKNYNYLMPLFKILINHILGLERIRGPGMQTYANQLWSANDVTGPRSPTICSGSAANPVFEVWYPLYSKQVDVWWIWGKYAVVFYTPKTFWPHQTDLSTSVDRYFSTMTHCFCLYY